MKLDYVPLLATQQSLYQMPRGFARFQEYLRTMIDVEASDLKLPLVSINPMGKDHLLALDGDGEGARLAAQTQAAFDDVPVTWRVSLTVVDDLLGSWTNRYFYEFAHRCDPWIQRPRVWTSGWITAYAWTSEQYTVQMAREEVATCIYRAAYHFRYGQAQTLGELLAQEGYAMASAGATTPVLDQDDLDYTREALAPYLVESGQPTLMAALFGDKVAHELGYHPLGLSPRAGLALALHNARSLTNIRYAALTSSPEVERS